MGFLLFARDISKFLQQILMSCGEDSGLAQRFMEMGERGQAVLIASRFAFNHSPECQLELTLKSDALLINSAFPTKQPHPASIPITSDLTYRITVPTPAGSQNPFWLLRLRNGKTQMTFRSIEFDSLDGWRTLLKKHVYKFGFWEDFKPLRRISKGMGSAVYEVARVEDGTRFAVKAFWKAQFQQNKNLLVGLQKEIKILREIGQLKHNHLLGIEEVYDSDSSFYIVMELCGKDLLRGRVVEGGSKEVKIRQAMRQLLSGLAAMHDKGMMHRDIKPNNIMFRGDGRFELVITDFGLATHLGEDHPFVQCGTPGFVAPEVFKLTGNQRLKDFACDIFSMGVVFHILLTGQPLFKAENPKELFYKNSRMGFDLAHSSYSKVDPLPMSLLKKMLQIDSNERITAEQALKHEYFSNYQIKMRSPVPTFQSYNQFIQNNQQEFSQIELGVIGRKRHKGEYRKASQQ